MSDGDYIGEEWPIYVYLANLKNYWINKLYKWRFVLNSATVLSTDCIDYGINHIVL